VPLSAGLLRCLPDPTPDAEALLMAAEERESAPVEAPTRQLGRLPALAALDELAIRWWLLGLSQSEVAMWLGVCKQRVSYRVRRGLARLRKRAI
jgi:DNA-directed RNA polymerase specialized sigma24 family protein